MALTSLFGRDAAELDAGGDALTDDLAEQLRDLRRRVPPARVGLPPC